MKLKGHRVAHREMDDEVLGSAKAGTVKDVIDLDNQSLLATRFDDGEETILDRREVIDLGRKGSNNQTPVILRRSHLAALVRKPITLLSLTLMISCLGLVMILMTRFSLQIWMKGTLGLLALAALTFAVSKLLSTDYLISRER